MSPFSWERIELSVGRHRIIYGVLAALFIASLLTGVSMALYVSSGASRLDLSRPGYEKVRSDINQDKEDVFQSSGPINEEVLSDFQKRSADRRNKLNTFDAFDSDALDDMQLQIAPEAR